MNRIKNPLKKLEKWNRASQIEMRTARERIPLDNLIVRVESILNTPSITQASDDFWEVLRPMDLLQPRKVMTPENVEAVNSNLALGHGKIKNSISELRKRFRKTEECLDKFWKIWRSSYLNCLRERAQRKHRQGRRLSRRIPKTEELILLGDEDTHKGPFGRTRNHFSTPSPSRTGRVNCRL